jgi:hypothetical protein
MNIFMTIMGIFALVEILGIWAFMVYAFWKSYK